MRSPFALKLTESKQQTGKLVTCLSLPFPVCRNHVLPNISINRSRTTSKCGKNKRGAHEVHKIYFFLINTLQVKGASNIVHDKKDIAPNDRTYIQKRDIRLFSIRRRIWPGMWLCFSGLLRAKFWKYLSAPEYSWRLLLWNFYYLRIIHSYAFHFLDYTEWFNLLINFCWRKSVAANTFCSVRRELGVWCLLHWKLWNMSKNDNQPISFTVFTEKWFPYHACAGRGTVFYTVMTRGTKEYKGKAQFWFVCRTWPETYSAT